MRHVSKETRPMVHTLHVLCHASTSRKPLLGRRFLDRLLCRWMPSILHRSSLYMVGQLGCSLIRRPPLRCCVVPCRESYCFMVFCRRRYVDSVCFAWLAIICLHSRAFYLTHSFFILVSQDGTTGITSIPLITQLLNLEFHRNSIHPSYLLTFLQQWVWFGDASAVRPHGPWDVPAETEILPMACLYPSLQYGHGKSTLPSRWINKIWTTDMSTRGIP